MRILDAVRQPLQARLRTIHHTTSVETAIRMLESKCIWSQDLGSPANFSVNQTSLDRLDEPSEVSLCFEYKGTGKMVPFDFSIYCYKPDTLYFHVTNGLNNENLENLKIWAVRWPAGSSNGMKCAGFHLYNDYFKSLNSSPKRQLLVQKLIDKLGDGVDFRVPFQAEIQTIENEFPITRPGKFRALRQDWFGKNPMVDTPAWQPSMGDASTRIDQ